jgi:hypothetical protein
VRQELLHAYAPRSQGPLGTALRSFARFAASVPNRELFKSPHVRGDLRAEAHNEWTMLLFAWAESQCVSKKTKRKLKIGSIEQKVSLVKGLLSHRYGFQLVGEAPRLKTLFAQLRSAEQAPGVRRKRRGIRRRHLKRAWKRNPHLRASSPEALNTWAAATTAWHVLARGGELSLIESTDLTFHKTRAGQRYACLMVTPLKKKKGTAEPKTPQFITDDGSRWGPFHALKRLARSRKSTGKGRKQPLFRGKGGKAMSTARVRAIYRHIAKLLGFDVKQFGAHSGRIGGATDLVATGNPSVPILLQAKGRWASDIGKIYARQTRRAHLAASDLMFTRSTGKDLEEIMPNFVQPA